MTQVRHCSRQAATRERVRHLWSNKGKAQHFFYPCWIEENLWMQSRLEPEVDGVWLKVSSVTTDMETPCLSTREDWRLTCSDKSGFNIWMVQSEFGINNLKSMNPCVKKKKKNQLRQGQQQSPAQATFRNQHHDGGQDPPSRRHRCSQSFISVYGGERETKSVTSRQTQHYIYYKVQWDA